MLRRDRRPVRLGRESLTPCHIGRRTSLVVLTASRAQNSNVVKFFSLLKKDDREEQMVYYQVRGTAPPPIMTIDRADWSRTADRNRDLHHPAGVYRRRTRCLEDP